MPKNFQLHHFLNPFSQLPAVKKDSKNDAARKFFGRSYFVTALASIETHRNFHQPMTFNFNNIILQRFGHLES